MLHQFASITPTAVAERVEGRILFSYSTSVLPTVASADFNGDGSAESLVWVNVGRHRLGSLGLSNAAARRGSLLLLDNSGSLVGGPLVIRVRGNAAPMVAAADFNGDGATDLVVAGRRLSGARRGLTLLNGNGDGTFGAGTVIGGAPATVTSLVAGDFNGDGRADLAGTARGNRLVNGSGNVFTMNEWDRDGNGGFDDTWQVDAVPVHGRDARAIGVTAEGGGGLAGGDSGTFRNFNPFIDHRPAPGFPSDAAVTGASGEAGGAVVGGFPSDSAFFDGLPIGDADDQVFLLLGNGDGTFGTSDDSGSDGVE